ncbi:prophage protein [Streptococcus pneumoniae]|nr:prophage protein [Streptococcus pneumoniae]
MLKVTKTRQLVPEFFAQDGDQQKLVKTTVINTDNKAVSTISETLHDPELYANNRISMRKHEQELREMRYKIEDAILAELEADAEHKE